MNYCHICLRINLILLNSTTPVNILLNQPIFLITLLLFSQISRMELIIIFLIVLGFVNGQSFDPDAKTTIEILDVDQFKIFNYSIEVQVLDLPPIKFPSFHTSDPFTPYDGNRVDFSNCRKKIAVYSHGYATTDLADAVSMKNALFEGAQHMIDCVVLLDWRLWCLGTNY